LKRTSATFTLIVLAFAANGCGGGESGSNGPVAGESVELETIDGDVLISEPGEATFVRLDETTVVPVGTEVDATEGTVRMTSETADGGSQTGEFSQGGFEVAQQRGSTEVTLALRGGDFSKCRTNEAKRDRSTVGGPVIRKLFVDAEGEFRTRGRFAAATIRGTRFTAVDACFGTLTDVAEGAVVVSDLTANKRIKLSAGQRYWAAQRPG
jgi:hypothetical protein